MSHFLLAERSLLLALDPYVEAALRNRLPYTTLDELRRDVAAWRRAAGAAQVEIDASFALCAEAHTKPKQCARALRAYGYEAAAMQIESAVALPDPR
jgi:hypothetical protein